MAKYDPDKDVLLKEWKSGSGKGDLIVGIHKYNGGGPKLAINRISEDWKTGELIVTKSGRFNSEDIQYLDKIWKEIMEEYNKVLE